jgi:hypothetical protein
VNTLLDLVRLRLRFLLEKKNMRSRENKMLRLAGTLVVAASLCCASSGNLYGQWGGGFRPIQPPFPISGYVPSPADSYYPPDPLPYTDAVIQRNVSLQLASDPVLRSAAIQATVLNGTATLNGVVSTWGERRQAQLDAYAAGARLVNNKLLVQTRATDNSGAAR